MNKPTGSINKVIETILSARIVILIAFLLAFVGLAFSALSFKIDASAETLLTKNNALYIKTQLANQTFSPAEFILVAYQPNDKNVYTQQTFDVIEKLSNEFNQIERVETTNSMLSVPLIESRAQLMGGQSVAELNYLNLRYSPEKMKDMLSGHPIFTDLLINKANTATAIQLVFKSDPALKALNNDIITIKKDFLNGDISDARQAELDSLLEQAGVIEEKIGQQRLQEVQQIEQIIQAVARDANVYIGGSYVVGVRLVEIVRQDLVYFGIGISILISILLLALFRSAKWLMFPMFACGTSVVVTLGILSLLKIPATVISANFVALQIILTLAIMLHLITCYREVSRTSPDADQSERIKQTLNEKLAPCFYAAITTSVGFGSLIFSGIQPVIDFGIMMLISNAVTLGVALLVFPAMLSFLKAKKETKEHAFVTTLLASVKGIVNKQTKLAFIIPLVVFGLVSVGILRLNVENSFIDYFHEDTKIHQELSFIDQQFGGSTPLDIIIDIDKPKDGLFLEARQINTLHLGHAAIDAFDATGNVTSMINFTTLAKQLNDDKPLTEYELDIIYKLVDKDVIDNLIGAYVDVESSTMRISTRIQDTLPGLNRAELLADIKGDLEAVGLQADQYQLTSLFVLYQDILSKLFDSQIATLGIVYAALAIILLIIFRSIKIALITLVPNIITTTAILGIIGWFNIPLDLMTITIAAIAMGIAIDDTIHFTDAFLSAKPGDEMNSAFSHTGLAICYTTTLIAVGFSMFVFSDFMPSVYFGLLTACAMLLALFTDLTVLPALLKTFAIDDKKQT